MEVQENIGVVKFFNENKGYGFIIEDNSLTDYFMHVSKLKSRVKKGDRVSFEVEQSKKGLQAVNIKLL